MKKIEVEIKGTTPLLMHNMGELAMQSISAKSRKSIQTHSAKEDAEDAAYRMKSGELYIPSRCLKACIINAGSWYKFGKVSAKAVIAGCMRIEPLEIGLGTKKYEIDIRPVVIQKARIPRARPTLKDWKISFRIIYNEQRIDPETLKKIIEESGERVGLLDNRPQRYGENGTFKITKWKELGGKNKK